MSYTIRATYKGQTFDFTLHDGQRWLALLDNIAGITLTSKRIFTKYTLSAIEHLIPTLIGHEAVHIYQARKLGWKYLPVYVWEWIKAGCKYRQNSMEIEATANERIVTWEVLS
jgi:hypothetical protein